jgi:predicted DNA-binding transcriptional regulator AlpA
MEKQAFIVADAIYTAAALDAIADIDAEDLIQGTAQGVFDPIHFKKRKWYRGKEVIAWMEKSDPVKSTVNDSRHWAAMKRLAQMGGHKLTRERAAEIMQVTEEELIALERAGSAPNPVSIGPRTVRYREYDLKKWLRQQRKERKEPS